MKKAAKAMTTIYFILFFTIKYYGISNKLILDNNVPDSRLSCHRIHIS